MASLSTQIRWMLQCLGVVCSERSTRYRVSINLLPYLRFFSPVFAIDDEGIGGAILSSIDNIIVMIIMFWFGILGCKQDGDDEYYCVEKSKLDSSSSNSSNSSNSCSEDYKPDDGDDHLRRNYIFIPSMHGGVMFRKLT